MQILLFILAILFGTSIIDPTTEILLILCFCVILFSIYAYAGNMLAQTLDHYAHTHRTLFCTLLLHKTNCNDTNFVTVHQIITQFCYFNGWFEKSISKDLFLETIHNITQNYLIHAVAAEIRVESLELEFEDPSEALDAALRMEQEKEQYDEQYEHRYVELFVKPVNQATHNYLRETRTLESEWLHMHPNFFMVLAYLEAINQLSIAPDNFIKVLTISYLIDEVRGIVGWLLSTGMSLTYFETMIRGVAEDSEKVA